MYTEQIKEHVLILEDGSLQIKKIIEIYKNDVLMATNVNIESCEPGDVVVDKSARVKDIATVLWKPEVIAAHQAAKQAANNPNPKGK